MSMGKPKKVVIHQIQESLTNLEDTLDYFEPDYVFLLSSEFYSKDKPDMALMEIKNKNVRALGDNVVKIEYSELVTIEEAWHKTTMSQVYDIFGKIKSKCERKSKTRKHLKLQKARGVVGGRGDTSKIRCSEP